MIKGSIKRNGKDVTFAKAWHDEVNPKAIKDMISGTLKDLLWKTQAPVSPGVTSDRARTYQGSSGGGSVSSFDEVNKSKRKKKGDKAP